MSLVSTIYDGIIGVQATTLDFGSPTFELEQRIKTIQLESGTGSGQASKLFSDERTLAASATENLDLAASLIDAFGATITFASIKAIYIEAADGNTNDVVIGGAESNAFVGPFGDATDKIKIRPGGRFVWAAPKTGFAVTAGTGDILLVANGGAGTPVTYRIVLIGT